jgi:hypothetical protein
VTLDPLDDDAIDALLRGLVPGIEDDAVGRIRERAEGVPFYAVETVRMLLDRGLLEPGDAGYRVIGDLTSLQVPETLQTLISARLDSLDTDERMLLQDASVLGKTFTARGLAALAGSDEALAPPPAQRPRSHGAPLPRLGPLLPRARPVRVPAGARPTRRLRDALTKGSKGKAPCCCPLPGGDGRNRPGEIAEVIAAHFLDAFRADEEAQDAEEIRASARAWLERAAERATSLAAAEEAQRAFGAAAELADS